MGFCAISKICQRLKTILIIPLITHLGMVSAALGLGQNHTNLWGQIGMISGLWGPVGPVGAWVPGPGAGGP